MSELATIGILSFSMALPLIRSPGEYWERSPESSSRIGDYGQTIFDPINLIIALKRGLTLNWNKMALRRFFSQKLIKVPSICEIADWSFKGSYHPYLNQNRRLCYNRAQIHSSRRLNFFRATRRHKSNTYLNWSCIIV